jgi:hypothetical protein
MIADATRSYRDALVAKADEYDAALAEAAHATAVALRDLDQ